MNSAVVFAVNSGITERNLWTIRLNRLRRLIHRASPARDLKASLTRGAHDHEQMISEAPGWTSSASKCPCSLHHLHQIVRSGDSAVSNLDASKTSQQCGSAYLSPEKSARLQHLQGYRWIGGSMFKRMNLRQKTRSPGVALMASETTQICAIITSGAASLGRPVRDPIATPTARRCTHLPARGRSPASPPSCAFACKSSSR